MGWSAKCLIELAFLFVLLCRFCGVDARSVSRAARPDRLSQRWHDFIGITLGRKPEDATQIDPFNAGRRNLSHQFGRNVLAAIGPALQHLLHLHRVPRHHQVGQQIQGVGHRLMPFTRLIANVSGGAIQQPS